jgi:hypothetical protein
MREKTMRELGRKKTSIETLLKESARVINILPSKMLDVSSTSTVELKLVTRL